jgi:hypothetical protein
MIRHLDRKKSADHRKGNIGSPQLLVANSFDISWIRLLRLPSTNAASVLISLQQMDIPGNPKGIDKKRSLRRTEL